MKKFFLILGALVTGAISLVAFASGLVEARLAVN